MRAATAVIAGVLGSVFGSFLNVVIHRVPRGESIVSPPSSCPNCGRELHAFDNVPLVSYAVLRGRCRFCGARISLRYPLVEALTAALWVGCALRFEKFEEAAFVAGMSTVLIALALIDLEHRRIPNVIVLPATAAAALWVGAVAAAHKDGALVVRALGSGLGFFMLLLVVALLSGGMGLGDVKLGAFVGVISGRFGVGVAAAAVLAGFMIGGVVALALLATRRRGRKESIPFGPAMSAGAVVALFGGEHLVRSWLGL